MKMASAKAPQFSKRTLDKATAAQVQDMALEHRCHCTVFGDFDLLQITLEQFYETYYEDHKERLKRYGDGRRPSFHYP